MATVSESPQQTSSEVSSDTSPNKSPESSPRPDPEWVIQTHFDTHEMRKHGTRNAAVRLIRDWLQYRAAFIGIGITDGQINDTCLFPGEFDITFECEDDARKFNKLMLTYVERFVDDASTYPPVSIIDVVLGESFFITF